jgi:hypothetical protein
VDQKPNHCWPWTGCLNADGYGFVYWNSKSTAAHRLAFELVKGQVPEGMDLDHLCKNRGCCNPDHLSPVTHRENMERSGLIPRTDPYSIDTQAQYIDTARAIDTASTESPKCDREKSPYLINDSSIGLPALDTTPQPIPVSIFQDLAQTMQADRKSGSVLVVTARPRRADPFAPICVMQEPPELELVPHSARPERPSGTKADLGMDDWAETEFGPFWWGQTDEQLRANTVI